MYAEVSENSVEELGPRDQEAHTQLRQPKGKIYDKDKYVGVRVLRSCMMTLGQKNSLRLYPSGCYTTHKWQGLSLVFVHLSVCEFVPMA